MPVPAAVPISSGQAGYLVWVAARAPSLHNTQPWRFKVLEDAIELYADYSRQLRTDPIARELLISCGAALYGLRLAVRSLRACPVDHETGDGRAGAGSGTRPGFLASAAAFAPPPAHVTAPALTPFPPASWQRHRWSMGVALLL